MRQEAADLLARRHPEVIRNFLRGNPTRILFLRQLLRCLRLLILVTHALAVSITSLNLAVYGMSVSRARARPTAREIVMFRERGFGAVISTDDGPDTQDRAPRCEASRDQGSAINNGLIRLQLVGLTAE